MTDEELELQDAQAREKEIKRMMETPAMIETDEQEVAQTEGYVMGAKEVHCLKHRLEMGG